MNMTYQRAADLLDRGWPSDLMTHAALCMAIGTAANSGRPELALINGAPRIPAGATRAQYAQILRAARP